MGLSESDTRAKLIDPAIHARGWTEDLIRREETAGAIEIIGGKAHKRAKGRVDYALRVKINPDVQPVAVALIEAKAEQLPPTHGLEQVKLYAASRRFNVPFVFSSNGHLFVEFDRFTGLTGAPLPLSEFPTPGDLRARYEQHMGFNLEDPAARPLLTRYSGGEATRRYYQDAAIRAVLEKLARGERRALLALATGAGKTFIAVHLLRRIADAGQLRRALFICDRDELRSQASGAFQNVFGADAAVVAKGKPQKNARILIATYQTLDVDTDDADANFLIANYPENYFSHIVIDECHRSAWGKWSLIFSRNPNAVQIGLTATPRQLEITEKTLEAQKDAKITADNYQHFGEPVYEYDMSQGIEDGYLAACEIVRSDIFLDRKTESERRTGIEQTDLRLALDGQVQDHHRRLIGELLDHITYLEQAIHRVEVSLAEQLGKEEKAVQLLLTLPATGPITAAGIIAEIGTDMGRFPSASHLASWAGVCPGNKRSAGKQLSGAITKGNKQLKTILCEIAATIARTPDTYLHALYHRIARRRGKPRAMMAVAHSLLVSIYYMLRDQVPYQELGPDYFDQLQAQHLERHYVRRLEALGFQVTLTPAS